MSIERRRPCARWRWLKAINLIRPHRIIDGLVTTARAGRLVEARRRVGGSFQRWFVPPAPWAALTFVLIAAVGWPRTRPLIADSVAYRAMALGRFDKVPGTISGRVLHPACVRLVSYLSGLNVDQAFFLVALATLAALVGTVAWILKTTTGFGALVLPLLFTPVVVDGMFGLYYCQDLFYAALLSGFFVALMKGRKWLALLLLFPLFLTRESTILLAIAWGTAAWFDSDAKLSFACIAVMLAGIVVSRLFAALGAPNIHHTSELVFLALKPPFDSLRNLFGVILIPAEMRGMKGFTCPPALIVHLPRWLRYGSTGEFGICRPDGQIPIHTLTLWLSLFGVGPALVWALLRRDGCRALAGRPQWLKVAAVYGVACFFIAPAVSFWLKRDIGYAWPLFWIAIPALFATLPRLAPRVVAALLAENLAACWAPHVMAAASRNHRAYPLIALGTALVVQLVALWTFRGTSEPIENRQPLSPGNMARISAPAAEAGPR